MELYEEYTQTEFNQMYDIIYKSLVQTYSVSKNKKAILLSGQPGVGKSSFYRNNPCYEDYIPINGDDYRKFHPRMDNFKNTGADEYATRTQKFSNGVVEKLIKDLSRDGFNLIIEGTLRTYKVPAVTASLLREKQYNVSLMIITGDAEKTWKATIQRADKKLVENNMPRLVPIDKYNITIHNIPRSAEALYNSGIFNDVRVFDREYGIITIANNGRDLRRQLENQLNLQNWDKKYEQFEKDYIQQKIDILQNRINNALERG